MIDRMFELAKDPDCIFALFPDGGGRLLSAFRPDDARLFYPTGRVNESYTNYPEIRKLTGADGNLVSVYSSDLQLTGDGYFYNASASFVSYIRFIGYNFEGDTADKTFFARFYLSETYYDGSANYFYNFPIDLQVNSSHSFGLSGYLATGDAETFTIRGRWNGANVTARNYEKGKWYTAALTKKTLDDGRVYLELWVNGEKVGTNTLNASYNAMKATNRMDAAKLGLSGTADSFKYDFAMIFDRVLTDEEIQQYSNQPIEAIEAQAIEGTWDELFDSSSEKYIGNLPSGSLVKVIPTERVHIHGYYTILPDVRLADGVVIKFDLTAYTTITLGTGVDMEATSEAGIYQTTSVYAYFMIHETLDSITISAS